MGEYKDADCLLSWTTNKYQEMATAWATVTLEDDKVSEKVGAKIKAKFSSAENIDHDRFTGGTSFTIGNITLSTLDEGNTFTIKSIQGKFTQEELKPILMWATLEEASK